MIPRSGERRRAVPEPVVVHRLVVHPAVARVLRLLRARPDRWGIVLDGLSDTLRIRVGPWRLCTGLGNIAEVDPTGPGGSPTADPTGPHDPMPRCRDAATPSRRRGSFASVSTARRSRWSVRLSCCAVHAGP